MRFRLFSVVLLPMLSLCFLFTAYAEGEQPANNALQESKDGQNMPASSIPQGSIPLWDGVPPAQNPEDSFLPYMEKYLVKTEKPRGAVVVLPGGGYVGRAEHEGAPIAQRFVDEGLHGFVVQYRVAPHRYPAALMDVAQAIRIIRSHAEEWNVDPGKIAVLGFSAGGHLTASIGTLFKEATLPAEQPLAAISCRPDAIVLCYPVISSGLYRHGGSFDSLLGADATSEMREKLSLELRVTPDTPPAFIWHTADDDGVPVENSLLFAGALSKNKVPFELHVYPHGPHGLGLAEKDAHIATWSALCCEWLKGMGW